MEEIILDLRNIGKLSEDELLEGGFADDGCIQIMENMLLNNKGKLIRITIEEINK